MKFLFIFHESLEVVTNGFLELAENATDAQRVANNKAKKKEGEASDVIESIQPQIQAHMAYVPYYPYSYIIVSRY